MHAPNSPRGTLSAAKGPMVGMWLGAAGHTRSASWHGQRRSGSGQAFSHQSWAILMHRWTATRGKGVILEVDEAAAANEGLSLKTDCLKLVALKFKKVEVAIEADICEG
jgi:hypothetical protein